MEKKLTSNQINLLLDMFEHIKYDYDRIFPYKKRALIGDIEFKMYEQLIEELTGGKEIN